MYCSVAPFVSHFTIRSFVQWTEQFVVRRRSRVNFLIDLSDQKHYLPPAAPPLYRKTSPFSSIVVNAPAIHDDFLKIVNMSISASWIVLAVLLLRLLLKRAPKWITVLLWGIVAIRLICPFSIESVMSLIPSTETISPEIMMDKTPTINSGVPIINNIVNPVIGESFAPDPIASANPLQILIPVLAIAWIVGIVIMLAYTAISYFRVKSKIGTAVLFRDNIYQSENVISPFVLGIIKPKIYLPFNMNEQDMEHVIAHEKAHIRRKDHWWKPFGFLVLTLHWFNPLMWLG